MKYPQVGKRTLPKIIMVGKIVTCEDLEGKYGGEECIKKPVSAFFFCPYERVQEANQ